VLKVATSGVIRESLFHVALFRSLKDLSLIEVKMESIVALAREDEEILSCYEVMAELRPHIKREDFVQRVKRQHEDSGYELAYIKAGDVKAVAGFRVSECMAWGKFMYVDDLVAGSNDRSQGHGGLLFDWLVAYAREAGCDEFHLDSGVQRFDAHRFYLRKRMAIEGHHFGLKLNR
jgi:predicted GNAT superfamily acetyltransferase